MRARFSYTALICVCAVAWACDSTPEPGVGDSLLDAIGKHDGARGPNIATVYSDLGYGVRPPVVFYNRANEAGAMLKPGDFDWDAIFGEGVRWFHSGGIYAALSKTTSELIIEGMKAAKKHGAVTSFDLNYRGKLWESIGGLEAAQRTFKRIVEHVDVLVGNEEDLQMGLGVKGECRGCPDRRPVGLRQLPRGPGLRQWICTHG